MALNLETPKGVEILGPDHPGIEKILTKECLAFVAELEREFKRERLGVLQERLRKQFDLDNGALPDFLEETKSIRESDWKVASIPNDLLDRQVEITGPDAYKFIQLLTPRDLSNLSIGQCKYVLIINNEGGLLNDPVLLRLAENHFWLSLGDSDILLWAQGVAAVSYTHLTLPTILLV